MTGTRIGSSQVRLQTRSGTNQFNGALFYSTNNSALNANSWFNNLNGRERNWTNRQQYGGRIGGPIVRNKAFFFVLVDNQEYRTRQNVTGTVLTPLASQGLFRYFPGVENDNAGGGSGASVDENGNPRDWTQIDGATGPMRTLNLFSDVNDPNRGAGISNNAYIRETLNRMPTPNNFRTGDGLNTAGIDWVRSVSGIDNVLKPVLMGRGLDVPMPVILVGTIGGMLLSGIVVFEFLATGLGQAAYATYMAMQTNKRFTATQYALMTSLMAIPGTLVASGTGYMALWLGWVGFYVVCALVALPGMVLLLKIAPWGSTNEEISAG